MKEKCRFHITQHKYFCTNDAAWAGISDDAKDLVDRMLTKDPQQRISIEEILGHRWLSGVAPDTDLGAEYENRIKNLALRQKIKTFFIANRIEEQHKFLRESFREVLPFLRPPDQLEVRPSDQSEVSIVDDDPISTNDFSARIMQLKEILVSAIYEQSHPNNDFEEEGKQMGHSKRRRLEHQGEIDFGIFCDLVSRAGLEVLAVPEVFNLFDLDGSGTIDMKEFLSKCRVFVILLVLVVFVLY
jgi:serine/threonine protein kinase